MVLTDVLNKPGQGLQAIYSGKTLKLGHGTFCAVDDIVKSKELIIYLTLDEQLLAAFELGDELRSSAKQMLTYCQQHNIKSTMLTGDHSLKCEEVCELLNIDHLQKGRYAATKTALYRKTAATG